MSKQIFNEQLYFAYGSNINLEQMAWRCPGAEVFGPAVLEGYEATGIEMSDEYARLAAERIASELRQAA